MHFELPTNVISIIGTQNVLDSVYTYI